MNVIAAEKVICCAGSEFFCIAFVYDDSVVYMCVIKLIYEFVAAVFLVNDVVNAADILG